MSQKQYYKEEEQRAEAFKEPLKKNNYKSNQLVASYSRPLSGFEDYPFESPLDYDELDYFDLFDQKVYSPIGLSLEEPKRKPNHVEFVNNDVKKKKKKKKKKLKKKRVHRKPVPQVIDPLRKWELSRNNLVSLRSFKLASKSRLEAKISLVPEKLYSSIKYQFFVELDGEFYKEEDFSFLLVKLEVFDSKNHQVYENGVEGNVETALNKVKGGKLVGKLRAQFKKSLSSHNTSNEYLYRLSFFLPKALKVPVFSISSPSFKILSRKPNKKKRRREEDCNDDEQLFVQQPPSKKKKLDIQEEEELSEEDLNFELFKEKLDDLLSFQRNLQQKESLKCQKLLCDWLQQEFL